MNKKNVKQPTYDGKCPECGGELNVSYLGDTDFDTYYGYSNTHRWGGVCVECDYIFDEKDFDELEIPY